MTPPPVPTKASVLREALGSQLPAWRRVAGYSLVISLLVLMPTWFMLEVYERVVNSRNERTLVMLLIMVLGSYAVMELLDWVRMRLLHQAGEAVDRRLRVRLFDAVFQANLQRRSGGSVQPFTDLRTLREFIASPAVTAVADAPASLVFLVLVSAMHPWLGVLALLGAVVQVLIALSTERQTMPLLTDANRAAVQAQNYAGSTLRNAQVIEAMGMLGNIRRRWLQKQHKMLSRQASASDHGGLNSALSKSLQQMLGSLLLGVSCWLVLGNQLPGGGMMIVASVLGARVLQPLALLVLHWASVVQVRDACRRLDLLFQSLPEPGDAMPLPAPKGELSVEGVVAGAPGSNLPILRGVSFAASPGELVAIIGPSASGKTTLARLLIGVWPAVAGKVRLDGVDMGAWNKAELGAHLGYLPQGVELFDGTLAENIARFGRKDPAQVRESLCLVGLDAWVDSLPDREHTRIGDEGAALSGGQRQRIGLARALYGNPRLVVLDEPDANLDEAGEQALIAALGALKQRGATVLVISHRRAILPVCDKLLLLQEGKVAAFGPRDEVLASLRKAAEQAASRTASPTASQTASPTASPTSAPTASPTARGLALQPARPVAGAAG